MRLNLFTIVKVLRRSFLPFVPFVPLHPQQKSDKINDMKIFEKIKNLTTTGWIVIFNKNRDNAGRALPTKAFLRELQKIKLEKVAAEELN